MNANSLKFWIAWPDRIEIYQNTAGQDMIFYDKGRRFSDSKGNIKYMLKKRKVEIKPPEYDYFYPCNGGKGRVLHLDNPSPNIYLPMKKEQIDQDTAVLKLRDDSLYRQWFSDRVKEQWDRWVKKSDIMKYLPIFLFAICLVIVAVAIMFVFDASTKMQQSASGAVMGIQGQFNVMQQQQLDFLKEMVKFMQTSNPNYKFQFISNLTNITTMPPVNTNLPPPPI